MDKPRDHPRDGSEDDISSASIQSTTVSPVNVQKTWSRKPKASTWEPFTVVGFLVAIKNVLVYQIDLILTTAQEDLLKNAQKYPYRYHQYAEDHLHDPDFTSPTDLTVTVGRSYVCRLRSLDLVSREVAQWKVNWLTIFAKQLTDRGNGWVLCEIHRVDQYRRLIVDLTVVTTEGSLSLRDKLLSFTTAHEECHNLLV